MILSPILNPAVPTCPSVRYWTLRDILDRPENDPDVLKAREAILQQSLVQELFARQHPEGHWGEDQTKPYTVLGAVTILALLHMLGVPPDVRTTAGYDSFLDFCQNACGGFSLTRTTRSGIFPCTTGQSLTFLMYFGLGDDPRVSAAFRFLIKDMKQDDPLVCGRYQHQSCLWGAIAALNGLAVMPPGLRSEDSAQVVKKLADRLLQTEYAFEGEHKRWLTFGVPRAWDLLSALRSLTLHGMGHGERFMALLSQVLSRQDAQGRWTCGSVSRTWPLEKRNQPSKWVTLDVLRVLKALG